MKKIYIAGPMSGIPEFNFPAFSEVELLLTEAGFEAINPAKKEIERNLNAKAYADGDGDLAIATGFDFREAYLWDVTKVIEADGIYMLPGWQKSAGAMGEHAIAIAIQAHYPAEYEIMYG